MKPVIIGALSLALVGAACSRTSAPAQPASHVQTNQAAVNAAVNATPLVAVQWQLRENGWQPSNTPPDCPDPLTVASPTDVSRATSILYPGQTRGGNYKPHGGFRFDTISDNTVTVVSPIDGFVVRGARYLVNGEIQYTFDLIHSCGIMVRLGHLRELPAKWQALADAFPAAQENDSRTNLVQPQVAVTAGETIATKVGLTTEHNTFFDFGLYDLRQKNQAASDPAYAAAHGEELDQHALCWLTMLPAADVATVQSLPPGDPTSGKSSDYCR